jgi:HD-GYP domain-containing protein (c-di-GMP phosphodiesterase class II)
MIRALRTSTQVPVSVDRLRTGVVLKHDMLEDHPTRTTVLLHAGSELTHDRLRILREARLLRVLVEREEVSRLTRDAREDSAALRDARNRAAGVGEREQDNPWTIHRDSLLHDVRRHGAVSYDPVAREEIAEQYDAAVDRTESAFDALAGGARPDVQHLGPLTRDAIRQLTRDLDLFVAKGVVPVTSGYPSAHSVQTAMVGMSIGTKLGLRRAELLELGLGCLVHDVGMLLLDQRIVASTGPLDRVKFLEITKHPILTFDLLQNVEEVPVGSRMVAYQMHERCDGSGYPRGRIRRQIHPLARIAAVADVYVALVSPRPYRPAQPAYEAVVHLLQEVREGKLDPHAVRGLLHTLSLFPVGSRIETNDGRQGRVLRTSADYTRPIVELSATDGASEIVDLSATPNLRVSRAIEGGGDAVSAGAHETSPEFAATAIDFWE